MPTSIHAHKHTHEFTAYVIREMARTKKPTAGARRGPYYRKMMAMAAASPRRGQPVKEGEDPALSAELLQLNGLCAFLDPIGLNRGTLSVTSTADGNVEVLLDDGPQGFFPVTIAVAEKCLVVNHNERCVLLAAMAKLKAQQDNVVGILQRLGDRVQFMVEGHPVRIVVLQGRLFYEAGVALRPVLMDYFGYKMHCGKFTVGAPSFERAEFILNQERCESMTWDLDNMRQVQE
jgi:hypothetical protein